MSEEKKKPGRPRKDADDDHFIQVDEVMKCYSDSYRMEVSCLEMMNFLHGSGAQKGGLKAACQNLEVFIPFVVSRLYGEDVSAVVGRWLLNEKWEEVNTWRMLCERWNFRWEKPRKKTGAGNMAAVWRLGCMVEGWRLLDEYYVERPGGYLYPPAGVIREAGLEWIQKRGVSQHPSESILKKYRDRFEEISLGWIPRNPIMRGNEITALDVPEVTLELSQAAMDDLARKIDDYESEHGYSAQVELEYLAGLDWPSADETVMPR
jgi:hypothetical protein